MECWRKICGGREEKFYIDVKIDLKLYKFLNIVKNLELMKNASITISIENILKSDFQKLHNVI